MLTKRQKQVLEFVGSQNEVTGQTPSLREIVRRFDFRSVTAAADHIRALVRKGALKHRPGLARSWQIVSSLDNVIR